MDSDFPNKNVDRPNSTVERILAQDFRNPDSSLGPPTLIID